MTEEHAEDKKWLISETNDGCLLYKRLCIGTKFLLKPLREACDPKVTDECNLPVVHATSWERLDSILASGEVGLYHCKIFEEDLCYLFYGRLAFRLEPEDSHPDQTTQAPIVFVFKDSGLRNVKRVLPFDSGGYNAMFRERLPFLEDIDEFDLEDIDHADGLVNLFWKSREAYFFFDYKEGMNPENDFLDTAQKAAYYSLLQKRNVDIKVDDRRGSIEVASDQAVPVNADTLVGVIAPISSMKNRRLVELQKNGVDVRGYLYFGESAIELTAQLRRDVYALLCDKGLLKPGYGE